MGSVLKVLPDVAGESLIHKSSAEQTDQMN
jgi:hypothetical protein